MEILFSVIFCRDVCVCVYEESASSWFPKQYPRKAETNVHVCMNKGRNQMIIMSGESWACEQVSALNDDIKITYTVHICAIDCISYYYNGQIIVNIVQYTFERVHRSLCKLNPYTKLELKSLKPGYQCR